MPNDIIYETRDNLSKLFSQNADAFRLVSGIAIGVPPAADAPTDTPVIAVFVRNAPHCELQELWNQIRRFTTVPFSLLITSDFVGLQVAGGSIGLNSPSQGNLPEVNAGTLGAVIQVGQNFYLLGSNHAMAFNGRALAGTPVLTPGTIDDANGGTVVGRVTHVVRLEPSTWPLRILAPPQPPTPPPNRVDCALAETTAFTSAQLQLVNVVPPVAAPTAVTKIGRTSGLTRSRICFWDFDTFVEFSFGTFYCTQLMGTADLKPRPQPWPAFAEHGDSGAMVRTTTGEGLGLVMAKAFCSGVFQPTPPAATLPPFTGYIVAICSLSAVCEELATVIGGSVKADQFKVFVTR